MKRLKADLAVWMMMAGAVLSSHGCATQSSSGAGEDRLGQVELIGEPAIKDIAPGALGMATSRPTSSLRAELAARNATGMPKESLTDVLFDFDRASIRVDALPALEANAKRLKEDRVTRVLLEGRGDEVGTAAYNLVLGDRRAKSVQSYLEQLGLAADFKTTSYGKDRPLCVEHNQNCLQMNRSVHFIVKE